MVEEVGRDSGPGRAARLTARLTARTTQPGAGQARAYGARAHTRAGGVERLGTPAPVAPGRHCATCACPQDQAIVPHSHQCAAGHRSFKAVWAQDPTSPRIARLQAMLYRIRKGCSACRAGAEPPFKA